MWSRFRAARKRGIVVWTGGWYFVMIPIPTLVLHIFSEMHPRAGFPRVTNSLTLKSHKHSEIRHFSGTVQDLGLVLVRND